MKSTCAYLNSNDGTAVLAFGETDRLRVNDASGEMATMKDFLHKHAGRYIFTGLSYDLKQSFLSIASQNPDFLQLPDALFWVPEVVLEIKNDEVSSVLQGEWNAYIQQKVTAFFSAKTEAFQWQANLKPRTSQADYLDTVKTLQEEIQYGSIYEVNYCQEFYDDQFDLTHPEAAYFRLNAITQAPFSAYFAFDEFHLICGSPERFLDLKGTQLRSQPIKGTRKRSSNPKEDARLKEELINDPKERAENVMIVDLVRNDLSQVAQKSSVQVEELFGIYSFNTVHQMISTITCEVKPEVSFLDILKATFPMGSMTGAPKRSAVSLIEKHENFKRGWYSGSVGYISPNGDFDLNVVIRSLIHNQDKKYLSCAVGGAITIQSTPEAEYEECQVKVQSILDQMYHA